MNFVFNTSFGDSHVAFQAPQNDNGGFFCFLLAQNDKGLGMTIDIQ